ncbi:P-loop containing nucleoside triphosphate hydrolase protein [Lophium mytilinum]|uniref:DNA 3'-5' helicase n=1 Tax=Lophium mytilinum TaxID=390894 RepID=A0A6A6Q8R7_9PEZI|nr:P-loop containing nucleoside triphosphate hydrolase protein [Lophium mytilinum]
MEDASMWAMLDQLEQGHQVPSSARELSAVGYEELQPGPRQNIEYRYESPRQYGVGEIETHFDAFDKELMRRPLEDRQAQAEQGRARLSLAPSSSRYFDDGAPASQPMQAPPEMDMSLSLRKGSPYASQPPGVGELGGLFAYRPPPAPESSSDSHALLSSPAMRASQRRSDIGPPIPPPSKRPLKQEHPRQEPSQSQGHTFEPSYHKARAAPKRIDLPHAPPTAQGIALVPVTELPDRLRTVFPFPLFNAIQSKCFQQVYKSSDNFVLASPTGSGKTAVLELAICRAINQYPSGQFKIVYQAPIKSLCSERQRDWQKKFGPLGLRCEELTGDSEISQIRNVQSASIIITTPEKWDSMTRKWKDHEKLMQLVKLFLIDEVHILKDERGATLEAVVSRMKSVSSDVRFVALSATVPNFKDVAAWLGKDATHTDQPAANEQFGEQFRPVKLQKYVCGYQSNNQNEFAFEKYLDSKLPEVIAKYSQRKPIMVFCPTRNSTVATAKLLANWWATKGPRDRYWEAPKRRISFADNDLQTCASSAVAFHHAGLNPSDRLGVENGFLNGDLNVICCTSTLAVGVNLPCHFAIIKNTVYWAGPLMSEYADLEIMQMLGRAGRPQFDDSAVAVIMTRQSKVQRYESMVSGRDLLESRLHLNLIDHLNAEIGLGTITNTQTAKKWLAGTFLFVRLKQNPEHYKLEGARSGQDIDEQLDSICSRDIDLLQDTNLVTAGEVLKCTEFGHAMARYYVQFETMRHFMGLPPKAKISDILSALAQAVEFKELRFRAGEKPVYKELNKSPSIRFPIPVDLALPMHKTSLIIQAHLGGAELGFDEKAGKHRQQYLTETSIIFKHINRLVRCIIDCELTLEDSVAIRNALMLERSLGGRAWDDSPMQIKQIEQLGIVAVRKLVNGGINSIEALENNEAHRIEMVLGKNPPFGMKLLAGLKHFPKLHVSVYLVPSSVAKCGEGVKIQVRAEIGFMNEKPATQYRNKPVYVCFLAETSDGHKVHFARTSGQKLGNGQDLQFSALLTSVDQSITCYVMCDEIAGTMRHATLKPEIRPSMFPSPKPQPQKEPEKPTSNTSRRRAEERGLTRKFSEASDEFGDDGLDDSELLAVAGVGDLDFAHIDDFGSTTSVMTRNNTAQNASLKKGKRKADDSEEEVDDEPPKLENGKWACNHRCGDKTKCKHLCCREGLDKLPKRAKKKATASQIASTRKGSDQTQQLRSSRDKTQSKLQLNVSKRKSSAAIEQVDLTEDEKRKNYATHGPRDFVQLNQLHSSIQKKDPPASVSAVMHKKPAYSYSKGDRSVLSFMAKENTVEPSTETSYGDGWMDDLTSPPDVPKAAEAPSRPKVVITKQGVRREISDPIEDDIEHLPGSTAAEEQSMFDGDDSELDAAMVGLADSQDLQDMQWDNGNEDYGDIYFDDDYDARMDEEPGMENLKRDNDSLVEDTFMQEAPTHVHSSSSTMGTRDLPVEQSHTPSSAVGVQRLPPEKGRSLFFNETSSSQAPIEGNTPMTSYLGNVGPAKKASRYSQFTNIHTSTDAMSSEKENVPPRNEAFDQNIRYLGDEDQMAPKFKVAIQGEEAAGSKNHDDDTLKHVVVPPGYEEIEPWVLAEFGDLVEFI